MSSHSKKKCAVILMLLLSSLWLLTRGSRDRNRVPNGSADFQTLYGMTRCMLAHCDPYNGDQDKIVFLEAGGKIAGESAFATHEPLYLPPALFATVPFAVFSWRTADLLWRLASVSSFLAAASLIAELCFADSIFGSVSISILLATSTMLIILDQPAMLTIGLLGIAVWCFLHQKASLLGECCMALSLAYKPHLGGLIWLYFLLAGGVHRKRALRSMSFTIAISIPGILWVTLMGASSHWMTEMPANMVALSAPGKIADVSVSNPGAGSYICLQSLLSVIHNNPRFYDRGAHLVGMVMFLAWSYPVFRMRPGKEKDLFAIASIACISLLPIYHHDYDSRILLLIAPAFALSMSGIRSRALISGAVTLASLIFISHAVQTWVTVHHRQVSIAGIWETVLWTRTMQLSALSLALFYLYLFYQALADQDLQNLRQNRRNYDPRIVSVSQPPLPHRQFWKDRAANFKGYL